MMELARSLRDCLGQFPTGVTVVTLRHRGSTYGVTIGSFTSVSLNPPLVMVSVNRAHNSCDRLLGTPFAVNILTADQRDLALHFAGRHALAPQRIRWLEGSVGPFLADSAGYLYCTPWAAYDGGDHVLYVGEVRYFEVGEGEPLVFHRGAFRQLTATPVSPTWRGSLDGPDGWLVPEGYPSRRGTA